MPSPFDIPATVTGNFLEECKNIPRKNAEDLRCGDVFVFRGRLYIALSCYTDNRHTQTIVTAICQESSCAPLQEVTSIRFFRTFRVPVCHHIPITLVVLDNNRDEITDDDERRLESIRGK